MVGPTFIFISLFIVIFGICYLFFSTRNKERLALIEKGADASNPENHIKSAYVTTVVTDGKTEKTNATTLAKGEYVYFCPLNPTPQYTLTVQ